MSPLNVGMIGTGGISAIHAKGVLEEPDQLRLVSASDVSPEALERFCHQFGVSDRYEDYRQMLANADLDIVAVLVPHHLHEEVCIAAAAAGKHILVEKPIARTVEEADRIVEAAAGAGVTLMVGHNQRYIPDYRRIHDLVTLGAIGEVFCARIDHHQDFDRSPGHWWRSKEAVGGGCVIGSGIHRLDLLRWYLGDPVEVFAYSIEDSNRLEGEVASIASIRFQSGAIAEFFCNWGMTCRWSALYGEGLSLFGTNGSIYKRGETFVIHRSREGQRESEPESLTTDPGAYESMWGHIAKCVNTGAEPLTSGREGRASLALVQAIYRSIDTGQPVRCD